MPISAPKKKKTLRVTRGRGDRIAQRERYKARQARRLAANVTGKASQPSIVTPAREGEEEEEEEEEETGISSKPALPRTSFSEELADSDEDSPSIQLRTTLAEAAARATVSQYQDAKVDTFANPREVSMAPTESTQAGDDQHARIEGGALDGVQPEEKKPMRK